MQAQYPPPEASSSDNIYFIVAVIAGIALISLQVLGSVKSTQSKEYQKLKNQLMTIDRDGEQKRKVSFDSEESYESTHNPSTNEKKPAQGDSDFNQDMDHQTLQ